MQSSLEVRNRALKKERATLALAVRCMLILMAVLTLGVCGCGRKADPDKPKSSGQSATASSKSGSITLPEAQPQTANVESAAPPAKTADTVRFRDVAKDVGIDFRFNADQVPDRFLLVESMGGAMAWCDFDLDGWLDLYLLNGNQIASPDESITNQLFRNRLGQFEAVTTASETGDSGYAFGVAVGDFDVDGFPDLYVTNYGANVLLRNNGDGTFSSEADEVAADSLWGTGCVWFDANNDLLPDLYVANYLTASVDSNKVCDHENGRIYCGPQQFEAQSDKVLVNNGDGSFRDATEELGFTVPPAYSLGVMSVDLNQDARPELIVATDMTDNSLFVQGEDGTWSDQASVAGVDTSGNGLKEAGMGIACDDFDGDGELDFYLTHYYEKKNTLYRNLGGMVFADDSLRSRVAATSQNFLGFGVNVIDVNRDNQPDLFVANGHVLGPNHTPSEMTAQILLNQKGRFTDISADSGKYFGRKVLGRGSATADFDNDGDTDIAVIHLDQPFSLLLDEAPGSNALTLEVLPGDRSRFAGGLVTITTGETTIRRPLLAGGSYLSASDPRIRCFLPSAATDIEVTVQLPGESPQQYQLPAAGHWRLTPDGALPAVW